jgi:DNA-binding LytR/AlgR family response regulator
MKTILIEDEEFAARRLENLIMECDPSIEVVAKLQSVKESVDWLEYNPQPDLIFLDIQLEDDLSFSIFEQVEVKSNIIFTTAFDEYAIKAFKHKSIDYLLKPIVKDELEAALKKHHEWTAAALPVPNFQELVSFIQDRTPKYRKRFSVMVGERMKSIEVNEIAYFFSTSGITFLVTKTNNQYTLDSSLDTIIKELDPNQFFRINRQYLIGRNGIYQVFVFPKSRLKLDLHPKSSEELYVSIDKVPAFKKWFDG